MNDGLILNKFDKCALTWADGKRGAAPFGKLRLPGRACGPAGGLQAANGAAPLLPSAQVRPFKYK